MYQKYQLLNAPEKKLLIWHIPKKCSFSFLKGFFLMFSLQGSLTTSTVDYQEMLPLASSLQQPAVNSSDVLEIERPASRASNI